MCATPTTDGTNALVATGYVGGEANWNGHDYDDEPMFLIFNGRAFAARLTYSTEDLSAAPTVDWVTDLGLDASYGYVPMQGMRIHMMDASANTVAVSAASCSNFAARLKLETQTRAEKLGAETSPTIEPSCAQRGRTMASGTCNSRSSHWLPTLAASNGPSATRRPTRRTRTQ
jgi:hypothetical protein